MSKIRVIDPSRLSLLPYQYWEAHEFCVYIHDQIQELHSQYVTSGAHQMVTNAFEAVLAEKGMDLSDVELLPFLKQNGLLQLYKHHVVSHLVVGLTGDMLSFLSEALSCFERRKFTVGFALLRKPLKENLLFLAWLLADQDDFISRFEENTHKSLNGVQPEQRILLFEKVIAMLPTKEAFVAEALHDRIFSKTAAHGFEPIWQRASHLEPVSDLTA